MAEGWWGSIVNSAKSKSAEVFEFVKKDFNELSSAVKTEATTIASNVKDSLQLDKEDSTANTVKRSLSSFFGQLSEALVPPSEDDNVYVPVIVQDGEPVQMTPLQLKLHELSLKDETYTAEIPTEQEVQFKQWSEVSEELLADVQRLTKWLVADPTLQQKYTILVPDQVSHSDFWRRYLFRRALLDDAEAEIERKKSRERKETETFNWEKEENFGPEIELTEEEQTRLLQQYEQEKSEQQQKKKAVKDDLKVHERNDIVIVGSHTPSQASTSSKESSTDGDWEKDFEIEESELPTSRK
ncbi:BSD domain-containing protein 1-like isoform X1 [Rhodnius prolixus]|uniref:BSD domain-containing protein 1-like isoform X1 n=1 Tax=Rhodnius prolixus TaxID=13249 RepID=UPI003D18C96A